MNIVYDRVCGVHYQTYNLVLHQTHNYDYDAGVDNTYYSLHKQTEYQQNFSDHDSVYDVTKYSIDDSNHNSSDLNPYYRQHCVVRNSGHETNAQIYVPK